VVLLYFTLLTLLTYFWLYWLFLGFLLTFTLLTSNLVYWNNTGRGSTRQSVANDVDKKGALARIWETTGSSVAPLHGRPVVCFRGTFRFRFFATNEDRPRGPSASGWWFGQVGWVGAPPCPLGPPPAVNIKISIKCTEIIIMLSKTVARRCKNVRVIPWYFWILNKWNKIDGSVHLFCRKTPKTILSCMKSNIHHYSLSALRKLCLFHPFSSFISLQSFKSVFEYALSSLSKPSNPLPSNQILYYSLFPLAQVSINAYYWHLLDGFERTVYTAKC
jgi:hypothetical protein